MNRRDFVLGVTMTLTAESSMFAKATGQGPVIVSAGRRVDAADAATPRFPQTNVPPVGKRIEEFLVRQRPPAIVSSAACGADLLLLDASLALESAGKIKTVKRYILLPSSPQEFRASSVTDRPGDWGELYDKVLAKSAVEVVKVPPGDEGYLQTNFALLQKAQTVAKQLSVAVQGLVIWNLQSRGAEDVTGHFLREAEARHIPVMQISTL
jgi:hypothetical protein